MKTLNKCKVQQNLRLYHNAEPVTALSRITDAVVVGV